MCKKEKIINNHNRGHYFLGRVSDPFLFIIISVGCAQVRLILLLDNPHRDPFDFVLWRVYRITKGKIVYAVRFLSHFFNFI